MKSAHNAPALKPYIGGYPEIHRPYSFLGRQPGEDDENFAQYMREYHNPALPEKYRLDDNWGYSFNSLGFRSEEYDPNAKKLIFTAGCSYAFGLGIKWEQTFAYVFKEKYAEAQGLDVTKVNLLSFAQRGASNDFIVRTLLAQCEAVKPDFLLLQFTTKDRSEFVDEKKVDVIGSWLENVISRDFFIPYTEEQGIINTLKNILLLQFYCRQKEIPYLFSCFDHFELNDPRFAQHPAIAPLIALIDRDRFCDFSLADFRCDVGRPCHHPGPLSNLRFGRKLFMRYRKLEETGKHGE